MNCTPGVHRRAARVGGASACFCLLRTGAHAPGRGIASCGWEAPGLNLGAARETGEFKLNEPDFVLKEYDFSMKEKDLLIPWRGWYPGILCGCVLVVLVIALVKIVSAN